MEQRQLHNFLSFNVQDLYFEFSAHIGAYIEAYNR